MVPWKVISTEDVDAIHQATLRVLGEVGIVLSHPEMRAQLLDAGAKLENDRILLPPEMVEKALADCSKQVTIIGRNVHAGL